ncbi:hypothetical protein [Nocardia sp. CA-120079]|uniref:hypothetical protein n=1 Tax=Nocardia sp. CA-120079 TaxID=3239974 RepID=UPI003D99E6BD
MSDDPANDDAEPATTAESEASEAAPQEPEQRTPPPRVGAVPDSVVFIQPPPVT